MTGEDLISQAASGPLATATNKQTTSKNTHPKERHKKSTSTASTQPVQQKRRTQAREAVRRRQQLKTLSAPQKEKKKYEKDPLVRKAALEADEWTANVQPASLWCLGCDREFQLDKRGSLYYQYNWNRHRKRCWGILRGEKGKVPLNEASDDSEDVIMDDVVIASEEFLDQPSPSQENGVPEHAGPNLVVGDDERDDDCATGQTMHLGLRTIRRHLPVVVYDPGNYAAYIPRPQATRAFSFTLRPATFTDAEINACAVNATAPNAIEQQRSQPAIIVRASASSTGPHFYRGDRRELLNPVLGGQVMNDMSAGVAMLQAFQRQDRMGARDGWIGRV